MEHPLPSEWIEGMMNVQAHRGPDDACFLRVPGCLLGFNRLSILDVSPKGRQPMAAEDSGSALVFNGEIYNYLELAEDLKAKGARFKSRSDSEVLLTGLDAHGESYLNALNGMFAFAFFQPRKGELLAARDRFGVKPFYYYVDDHFFCFASEIKALLSLPFITPRPNLATLFGSVFERRNDRSEETSFKDIQQLRPSHWLKLKRNSWKLELGKYFSLGGLEPLAHEAAEKKSAQLEDQLRDLLFSAVQLRLRSDRPMGLLLSGGMDSSSIAATLAALKRTRSPQDPLPMPRLFTMSLPGETMDEAEIAVRTAKQLDLKVDRIRCDEPDFERLVPLTLWHNDEPLPLLNRCIHYQMMEAIASENVIVILNGQGGDETTGGYFDRLIGASLIMAFREFGPQGFIQEWKGARDLCAFQPKWMLSQMLKYLLGQRWVRTWRGLTRERALVLATRGFLEHGILRDNGARLVKGDCVNDQLMRWLTRDCVPDLCHYEDRNAAAHGLEERFPFLDFRVSEFMFRLPWSFKTRNGMSKFLLRKAMQGRVPEFILSSYRKIGLGVPEDKWVRGPLREIVHRVVSSQSFRERGLWRAPSVRALVERQQSGKVDSGGLIWRIVSTELWFQMFIDSAGRPPTAHRRVRSKLLDAPISASPIALL
jgi:asparagine synthase (glutamine-hydrolysing)